MRNLFKIKNPENQRGVAAVEFAIVLPLLLFLFIGITEFGLAYYNKQVLTNAAREGARVGIISGTDVDKIKETIKNYVVFEDENNNKKSRLITFGPNTFLDNQAYKNNITVSNPDADNHRTIKVEFSYTYLILQGFNFFGANFGPNLNISSSTVMKMEP